MTSPVVSVAGGEVPVARFRRAQAKCADGGRVRLIGASSRRPQARLVAPVSPHHQHGVQVRYVAGGESQRLDLGEFPVGRLGGDEGAQRDERRVDAVRSVALARVRRLTRPQRHARPPGPLALPHGTHVGVGQAGCVGRVVGRLVGVVVESR